jgi:hypothetical protein
VDKIIYAVMGNNCSQEELSNLVKGIWGISGSSLYALSFNNISIAVSDFSASKFVIDKEIAIDFARVIEQLSRKLTLLPVRFGTFLKSDEDILKLLNDHYDSFYNNLIKVWDKDEFGVKVIWDYAKGSEKIKEESDKEDVKSDTYFSKSTVHTNYLLEKIRKHKLEDALLRHVEKLIEEISRFLAEINPECKFKKMVSNSLILDGVFLIEKDKKDEFVLAIEALKQQHNDLHLLLTGPWPPYSFVEIDQSLK